MTEEQKFKEEIENLTKELNLLGKLHLKDIPRVPYSYNDDDRSSHSVTLCPQNKTIKYTLNPIEPGNRIKSFVLGNAQTSRDGAGLFRAVISMAKARELIKNDFSFIYGLSGIINDGVRQLTKEFYDLSSKRKLTMEMPDGTYFKWNPDVAAFEIRLYTE